MRVNHFYFLLASGPSSSSLLHVYSENIHLVLSSLSPSLLFAALPLFSASHPLISALSLIPSLSVSLTVPMKRISKGKDQTALTGNVFKLPICLSACLSSYLSHREDVFVVATEDLAHLATFLWSICQTLTGQHADGVKGHHRGR